jgi:hypothetical protein
MPNIQVVDTTVALPAPIINMAVTFSIEEWAVIVEATANGSRTARDCEKRMECTISIRRHADGRTLVFYRSLENETYLSSLAVMATPRTTTDAIDRVCAHLFANTPGSWSPLVATFQEKYRAIPTMSVTTN